MTVATGPLGAGEAERAGLVPTHAYAVLNVVTIKVSPPPPPPPPLPHLLAPHLQGLSLMQLKNPWSERRWKVGVICPLIFGQWLLLLRATTLSKTRLTGRQSSGSCSILTKWRPYS